MTGTRHLDAFEAARPKLLGLAYRMLGSMADAEDAVQDTFVKWQVAERTAIANPEAWLTRLCTNRCLDSLKSAHRNRVDYVGSWIPEPLQIGGRADPLDDVEKAESLTTAFLLLLERLSPRERAAWLLREVFGNSYDEVAGTLDIGEAACRQLVSRAARHLRQPASRFVPPPAHQEKMLSAFLAALETGSHETLAGLLAETVQFQSDGGGKSTALSRVLETPEAVGKYVARILGRLWAGGRLETIGINGLKGLAVMRDDQLIAAVTFRYTEDGRIDRVFNIRNPDKLMRLRMPVRHDPGSGALWI
ncbi:sigma-70 family RNA polymerase sigma factor [Rhodobacterales bacterium]|nr:sigma-70 family RNA polymerase sigma factor [Rhodobacterales bacterium]